MGIPTFFRTILQNNKNIIFGASNEYKIDYLFIDFNSLIYNTWATINKTLDKSDENYIHSKLIEKVIEKTIHMVNDIVNPAKYVYISMDGVAPRAKMIQQRSRRYKSVQLKNMLQKKMQELNIEKTIEWDPSPNICPGTIFMQKLGQEFRNAMKNNSFHCQVFLSDSNVPGEGEHKFLKKIRKLNLNDSTKNDKIVVYSPDGDMISLSLLTHKNNIFIMRIPDKSSPLESRFCNDFEYIYCDLNLLRNDFFNQLTTTFKNDEINDLKVLTDYNFLLFMNGNDFVPSVPFLKIRSGGLNTMIKIYNSIRPNMNDYLINYDPKSQKNPIINMEFFSNIILELAKIENNEMNKEYHQYKKELTGYPNHRRSFNEKDMTEYELFESRVQHLCFFNPDHPFYNKYYQLVNKINYSLPKHEWKYQYYNYFCDLQNNDSDNYNNERTKIVINYFESLIFTLRYYLIGCPCFNWHYKYRVSPLPSDMITVINKFNFNLNDITFENSKPYTPFEQLMFILPPQMNFLLPKSLRNLMIEGETKQYYPKEFEIDALAGIKYIYSEAILPEIDTEILRKATQNCFNQLSDDEKKRNYESNKLVYIKKYL